MMTNIQFALARGNALQDNRTGPEIALQEAESGGSANVKAGGEAHRSDANGNLFL
jgi:hypothetical protein